MLAAEVVGLLDRTRVDVGIPTYGTPAFLAPDGTVKGKPQPATGDPEQE